jgi:enoyl-CoA hydratase/carnithine racemase
MTGDELVRFEKIGKAGVVTLNRPESMNALNLEMRRILPDIVRSANADAEIRVIVFRGEGEQAFCAGADVKEFATVESLDDERRSREPPNWNDVIAACRKPTLAAIQGFCLGGGLEIALACDIRIAADNAIFGLPEVRLAVIPGAGGTQRLPRVVGTAHALRLILTGDRIDAAEALRIGLVSEVVAARELPDRTDNWVSRLSAGGPLAVAYAKEGILRGTEMPITDGRRLEADLATLLTNTRDRLEGAAAFRERRRPTYRGE